MQAFPIQWRSCLDRSSPICIGANWYCRLKRTASTMAGRNAIRCIVNDVAVCMAGSSRELVSCFHVKNQAPARKVVQMIGWRRPVRLAESIVETLRSCAFDVHRMCIECASNRVSTVPAQQFLTGLSMAGFTPAAAAIDWVWSRCWRCLSGQVRNLRKASVAESRGRASWLAIGTLCCGPVVGDRSRVVGCFYQMEEGFDEEVRWKSDGDLLCQNNARCLSWAFNLNSFCAIEGSVLACKLAFLFCCGKSANGGSCRKLGGRFSGSWLHGLRQTCQSQA